MTAKHRIAAAGLALATYAAACGNTPPDATVVAAGPATTQPPRVAAPLDPTAGLDAALTTTPPRAPRAARSKRPRPETPQRRTPPAGGGVWEALARCESGNTNDGGAPFYGFFQFSRSTWQSLGYDGTADQHPYGVQLEAAQRLQARSGWGQWPNCSRTIGVR